MGGTKSGRAKSGLPKAAKTLASVCGYLRNPGGRAAAEAAWADGHPANAAFGEIGAAMSAAGWGFPSSTTFYKARAALANGGWEAGSPEAAIEATLALAETGAAGFPAIRERTAMAAAFRMWSKGAIPPSDSLPAPFAPPEGDGSSAEKEAAEPSFARPEAESDPSSPAANARFEAALALVEAEDLRALERCLARNGLGKGALARLLRRAAELSVGRTPGNQTCRVCLALLNAGASPSRPGRDGALPWELASGRTAAILAAAADYSKSR